MKILVSKAARKGNVQAMRLLWEVLQGEDGHDRDQGGILDELEAKGMSTAAVATARRLAVDLEPFERFCSELLTTDTGRPLVLEGFQEMLGGYFAGVRAKRSVALAMALVTLTAKKAEQAPSTSLDGPLCSTLDYLATVEKPVGTGSRV